MGHTGHARLARHVAMAGRIGDSAGHPDNSSVGVQACLTSLWRLEDRPIPAPASQASVRRRTGRSTRRALRHAAIAAGSVPNTFGTTASSR
jgi:hypothetical protein